MIRRNKINERYINNLSEYDERRKYYQSPIYFTFVRSK